MNMHAMSRHAPKNHELYIFEISCHCSFRKHKYIDAIKSQYEVVNITQVISRLVSINRTLKTLPNPLYQLITER